MNNTNPIRVVFQQPVLAEYRIAFYRELATRTGLKVKVVHGESPRIANCLPDGFEAEKVEQNNILRERLIWHSAQLENANKASCDVIVLSCNLRYLSLIPSILKAKRNGVRIVLWGHHFSKSNLAISKLIREQLLFRFADSIVCYGNIAAGSIRKLNYCQNKTFVALNAIDQQPIVDAQKHWKNKSLAAFREAHGIGDGPNLLFVSRIKRRNRLEIMLQAVKQLKSDYPNAMGFIIGQHNEEQQRLQQIAEQLGIGDSILFPGGMYDQKELAPWFQSSDIFFYPSQVGLSMLHGWGYGLPAVVGTHAHLRNPELDSLVDGVNGFRFEDGDVGDALGKISLILENSVLKSKMRTAAFDTVRKQHTIVNMANQFADAIRYASQLK